jgi:hypothetical protein
MNPNVFKIILAASIWRDKPGSTFLDLLEALITETTGAWNSTTLAHDALLPIDY